MLESKRYNTSSERIKEDLSGLLVGNGRESSIAVWLGMEDTIVIVIGASSNRMVC
jgi:hypothetical protein